MTTKLLQEIGLATAGSELTTIIETISGVTIGDGVIEDVCDVTVKRYKRKVGQVHVEACHEYGTILFEFPLEGELVSMSDEHIMQAIFNFGVEGYDYLTDPDFAENEDD